MSSIPEDELRKIIKHTMIELTGRNPGDFAVGVWEKTIRQYAAKARIDELERNGIDDEVTRERIKQLKKGQE